MIDENIAKRIVHLRWLSQQAKHYRYCRGTFARLMRCTNLEMAIAAHWRDEVGPEVIVY